MKKRMICKLIVIAVCAYLTAQWMGSKGPWQVLAGEVQPGYDVSDSQENAEETEHIWGPWKRIVKPTVLKEGEKQRVCSGCKEIQTARITKVKPTIKLNKTTISLKVKQTATLKVSKLAAGDYVKSYKSSNKKIFTVDKKGKVKAKKVGTAKLTVTLASGKKATAKIKVKKGIVETTKITVNASRLILLKGGKYKLKTTLKPADSQQKVTYSSSNKKVASVSSKGTVTAKKTGNAQITVKSGSKLKKINVMVQTFTLPKKETEPLLKSCRKIARTMMKDGNWSYYSGPSAGSNIKDSFKEARSVKKRQSNCANYVNFCMQDAGTLKPGMSFYSDSKAKIVYRGSKAQKEATKKMLESNYDIIKVGGKKAVNAELEPGDICLYKGHVNVFAGLNKSKVPMWYDAGRGSTSDGKQQSGYFNHMYWASYYNSMPVYIVLRSKK